MSKKTGVAVAFVGVCVLSLFLLNCGSSSSRPAGVLYVLTQGSNFVGNNVSSFGIDLNSGGLSLINSNASTCPTAGSTANPEPCGLPLDILLDPTGATAFVLNQGIPSASVAPTIYSYKVNSDGSLGAPTLAATLATGDLPITMVRDAAGSLLFVLEAGTNPLPETGCPLTSSSNSSYAGCPSISTFTAGATSLALASGSPLYLGKIPTAMSALTFPAPATGSGTIPPPYCGFTAGGSEEFLFVTNSQDLSTLQDDNTLSVYCVDSTGTLTDVTPTPPLNPQPGPLSVQAVNTSPAGQNSGGVFVYVGSQTNVTGSLSVFQMCTAVGIGGCGQQDVTNVVLKQVGTTPTSTGQNPVGAVVDPMNQFLYVLCSQGSSQVYGYLINASGALSPLNPPYLPTGSQPVALALHPTVNNTGQFLFVSNAGSSSVSGFTLNTTSGVMSSSGDPASTTTTPSGIAVH